MKLAPRIRDGDILVWTAEEGGGGHPALRRVVGSNIFETDFNGNDRIRFSEILRDRFRGMDLRSSFVMESGG